MIQNAIKKKTIVKTILKITIVFKILLKINYIGM